MLADRLPLFLILVATLGNFSIATANDIYVAQNATGLGNGQDCANTKNVTYFNTSAYWVSTPPVGLQIGPGTTVHLCNTITTELTVRKSGTSGSPITILFEPGAKISLPVCSNRDANGCINLSNFGYIILDGGTNGIIENTDSGSSLGHQGDGVGVLANGTHDSEIRNLTISNLYIHSSASDETDLSRSAAIYMAGAVNNLVIHNNIMHDCNWCINYQFSSSASGVSIYSNEIYHAEHGIAFGGYGGGTVSSATIYRNYIHDYFNWDVSSGSKHHDGIHLYTNAGSLIDGVDIYNNTFGGDPGVSLTSHIYIEHDGNAVNDVRVYNNVILPGPANRSTNFGLMAFGANTGTSVYNNTILCGSNVGGYGVNLEGGNTIFENNVITGCFAAAAFYVNAPNVVLNYNTYAGNANIGAFLYNDNLTATITSWIAATNQDANSQSVDSAGLDSATGSLMSGSPAIGTGINLTALGIAALNLDKGDILRPPTATWDAGAFQFSDTTVGPPSPPTQVKSAVH
jgi:hypothetical protein